MRAPLSPNKHVHAEQYVANFFRSNGWSVEMQQEDSLSADLLIRHGKHRFIVEIKALSEGRPDRVLPVLSMAILQAKGDVIGHSGTNKLIIGVLKDNSDLLVHPRHVLLGHRQVANRDLSLLRE